MLPVVPERNELALTLRRLRRERKMSQVDVAYAAGVSPSHITSVERGERRPSADALAAICDALKVSAAERHALEMMRLRMKRSAALAAIGDADSAQAPAEAQRSPLLDAIDLIEADDPEGFQTLAAHIIHHAELLARARARR